MAIFSDAQTKTEIKKIQVLVIEDCYEIIESIILAFRVCWPNAVISSIHSGLQAVEMVRTNPLDCLVLDLSLPDVDGFDVLQRIREFSSIPILILTAHTDERDIVRCLENGADEYMIKPSKQLELVTRIHRIVTRRDQFSATIMLPRLTFNPSTREMCYNGDKHILTSVQADILYYLMRENGHSITSTMLAKKLWGEADNDAVNSVDLYIRCIQAKFNNGKGQQNLIQGEGIEGYRLAASEARIT
ncbi:MAG: response regulator transcription factor [Dehalococcoidales bacterium]|nr:response regulator transcription factor [Dehalococcoidales bacterium]